jgi:hypothetical protein
MRAAAVHEKLNDLVVDVRALRAALATTETCAYEGVQRRFADAVAGTANEVFVLAEEFCGGYDQARLERHIEKCAALAGAYHAAADEAVDEGSDVKLDDALVLVGADKGRTS